MVNQELGGIQESEQFLGRALSGTGQAATAEYADESEFDAEFDAEFDTELEGEFEDELEAEDEFEDELEALLDSEFEISLETEDEYDLEFDTEGEYFFKGIGRKLRGLGRFVARGVKVLKPFVKVAAPLAATAIGGPLAGKLAGLVTSQLESDFEDEADAEVELAEPMTPDRAEAEALAAQAAFAQSESEAEALVGASVGQVLSGRDLRRLRSAHRHLVCGAAALTRLLYGHRATRPYTGVVPAIVERSARSLYRRARQGEPLGRMTAARVMAQQTARVMGNPGQLQRVLRRHVQGVRIATAGAARPMVSPLSTRQAAARTGLAGPGGMPRRVGSVSVSVPIRIPGRDGGPGRIRRITTRVPVPKGAVPVSHSATVRKGQ